MGLEGGGDRLSRKRDCFCLLAFETLTVESDIAAASASSRADQPNSALARRLCDPVISMSDPEISMTGTASRRILWLIDIN
jgi:hypothetical protein